MLTIRDLIRKLEKLESELETETDGKIRSEITEDIELYYKTLYSELRHLYGEDERWTKRK